MKTLTDLQTYMNSLSIDELLQIKQELSILSIQEDSIVRDICNEYLGNGIFVLQCQQLLWPLIYAMSLKLTEINQKILEK